MVSTPLPDNVRTWTVNDVARWLETLSLSQYCNAFVEGSVDGPFLMELREEDLIQVLGIKHQLHVRKILLAREKLKPLTRQELAQKNAVELEEKADAQRQEMGVPSLDTVFSQARNGRIKRVEESLNVGKYHFQPCIYCPNIYLFFFLQAFLSMLKMRRVIPYYYWLVKIPTSVWWKC